MATDKRTAIERLLAFFERGWMDVSFETMAEGRALATRVDVQLFSLQTNHDDLAKWHEKHKDDAAKVEELYEFIRSEGAAGKFIVWQATGGHSMTGSEIDKVLASLRKPMAVPKPTADTEEKP